jgi:hypothetical protein
MGSSAVSTLAPGSCLRLSNASVGSAAVDKSAVTLRAIEKCVPTWKSWPGRRHLETDLLTDYVRQGL